MTNDTNQDAYDRRIKCVIGYICSNLHQELSLDHLSEVAGFSKFHFHRQFTAYAGFTVAQFVRLTRLKRAAYQLAIALIVLALALLPTGMSFWDRMFLPVELRQSLRA